jgi:hypothetical protein
MNNTITADLASDQMPAGVVPAQAHCGNDFKLVMARAQLATQILPKLPGAKCGGPFGRLGENQAGLLTSSTSPATASGRKDAPDQLTPINPSDDKVPRPLFGDGPNTPPEQKPFYADSPGRPPSPHQLRQNDHRPVEMAFQAPGIAPQPPSRISSDHRPTSLACRLENTAIGSVAADDQVVAGSNTAPPSALKEKEPPAETPSSQAASSEAPFNGWAERRVFDEASLCIQFAQAETGPSSVELSLSSAGTVSLELTQAGPNQEAFKTADLAELKRRLESKGLSVAEFSTNGRPIRIAPRESESW